jgi:hypothetical protein
MSRLFAALVLALLALPAAAQLSPSENILTALRAKGYRIITEERTWLGRARIVAEDAMTRRELVFNPGTGEIFRDYSTRLSDRSGDSTGIATAVDGAPTFNGAGEVSAGDGPITSRSDEVTDDDRSVIGDPIVTDNSAVSE